jgi:hypothetical protein
MLYSMVWDADFELVDDIFMETFPSKVSAASAQGRSNAQMGTSDRINFMADRLSGCRGPVQ